MSYIFSTKFFRLIPVAVFSLGLILSGCSIPVESGDAVPNATEISASSTITSDKPTLVIAGPATPSSIPLLIAASKLDGVEVQIIENNLQANTAFLRGDIDILVNGLSVGVDLYRNEAPVQVVTTYVTGMSFLVTRGEKIDTLSALKDQEIYIPFEGSPIEEATSFLAAKEGLTWGTDIKPVYSPFDASIALLKQGKAKAVVLPEPFASLVEGQSDLYISIDLYESWNKATGQAAGYPQVAAFVRKDWAEKHKDELSAFNSALEEAVNFVAANPDKAVEQVKDSYKQPANVLQKAISRMHYAVLTGVDMKKSVSGYYDLIGKPLDDHYSDFYYLPAK